MASCIHPSLLGALLAAVGASCFLLIWINVWQAWRSRSYRDFSDWRSNQAMELLPKVCSPVIVELENRYRSMKERGRPLHEEAVALQARCHTAMAGAVGLATYAYVALAVGSVWHFGWLGEMTVLCAEVLGLVGTFVLFLHARALRSLWLEARARSEVVRSASVLISLFALERRGHGDNGSAPAFDAAVADVDARFGRRGPGAAGLSAAIREAWSARRADIADRSSKAQYLVEHVVLYLQYRVVRQLHWFERAHRRLATREHGRTQLLVLIFCVAMIAALVKLGLFLGGSTESPFFDALKLGLLLATAGAGATTAYFTGQNQRSLLHRYEEQLAQIRDWLMRFVEEFAGELEKAPTNQLSPAAQPGIVAAILDFEDKLALELVLWVSITEHDSLELSV